MWPRTEFGILSQTALQSYPQHFCRIKLVGASEDLWEKQQLPGNLLRTSEFEESSKNFQGIFHLLLFPYSFELYFSSYGSPLVVAPTCMLPRCVSLKFLHMVLGRFSKCWNLSFCTSLGIFLISVISFIISCLPIDFIICFKEGNIFV